MRVVVRGVRQTDAQRVPRLPVSKTSHRDTPPSFFPISNGWQSKSKVSNAHLTLHTLRLTAANAQNDACQARLYRSDRLLLLQGQETRRPDLELDEIRPER